MLKAKLTAVGNSTGMILPKEALAKLRAEKGDEIFLVETPTGYEITTYDPDFERQLKLGKQVMRRYRNALRELAK
ncbi:MAG: AbrB/MazE/SpoVT family DNA-binding domain-containing protein [Gammaproteobacteria bacterium]